MTSFSSPFQLCLDPSVGISPTIPISETDPKGTRFPVQISSSSATGWYPLVSGDAPRNTASYHPGAMKLSPISPHTNLACSSLGRNKAADWPVLCDSMRDWENAEGRPVIPRTKAPLRALALPTHQLESPAMAAPQRVRLAAAAS